jgi:hypothetical protein
MQTGNSAPRPTLSQLLIKSMAFKFGALFVVLGLIPFVSFFVLGRDIFEWNKALVPGSWAYNQSRDAVLALTGMFTGLGGVAAALGFWKCKRLATSGIIVVAQVDKVGSFQYRGMKDITYTYVVGQETFSARASVDSSRANDREIRLFVDQNHPKTHMML